MTYLDLLVTHDFLTTIIPHKRCVVVLDMNVLVFFGMDKYFLLTQFILKAQLVEA
ncbi:hypothetical protein D3C75_1355570 [compost metagenome]